MNFLKSIFSKTQPQQKQEQVRPIETSILDPNFTQVRLKDIKMLTKNQANLDLLLNYTPETINEQLKIHYTLHMLLSSGQIQTIDKVVNLFENSSSKVRQNTVPLKNNNLTQANLTQHLYSENPGAQFQNSMYLNVSDQIQEFEKINQNETLFANLYYNYIQRITSNSEVYNSCKFSQYPFQVDGNTRKMQLLWLFKITNLLNFKLSFLKSLEQAFKTKTVNTPIIRDITYLIYKDCLSEYTFLKTELLEMLNNYPQFQVKEVLEFYELYLNIKQMTEAMKFFHSMRLNFSLNTASVRDVKWFEVDKRTELELDHYISKAKLLNTAQFKRSLMVPNQRAIIENLHRALNNPNKEKDQKKMRTAKNADAKFVQLFSPISQHKQMQNREILPKTPHI